MPSSLPTSPAVRADTSKSCALSPCTTTALAPLSAQPSPLRTARVLTRAIS